MLTIIIALGGWSTYQWAKRVASWRYQIGGDENNPLSRIVRDFRIRSGVYRIAATALFIVLAAVTVAAFFVVSTPARKRAAYHEGLPWDLPALMEELTAIEGWWQTLTQAEAIELLTVILNRSTYPGWGEVAGAVTLWLVLVRVIASMSRYMVRLASFYDSRADYLQLGGKASGENSKDLLAMIDPGSVTTDGWIRQIMQRSKNSGEPPPSNKD